MPKAPAAVMAVKREKLIDALSQGHTRRTAAMLAGIHEDTVRDWELEGSEYSGRIREAELSACAVAERTVFSHVLSDPKIALAYLERRSRQDWGKNQSVELSGPQGGAIPVQFGALTTDELRRLADGPLPSPDSP